MRAAIRPHPTHTATLPAREHAASEQLPRLLMAVFATLVLLALWRPAIVRAQAAAAGASQGSATASTTHIVRAGESLWSIAERYYGSGSSWTELAKRNNISSSAARPVVVGMRLQVPSAKPSSATGVAAAKPPADTPRTALAAAAAPQASGKSTPSLASQTAGKSDAPAVTPRSASRAANVGSGRAGSTSASTSKAESRAAGSTKPAAVTAIAASTGATAQPDSSPTALSASTRVALNTTMKTETPIDRGAIRIGLTDGNALRAARAKDAPTIFLREVPTVEEARAAAHAAMPREAAAPRRGEYDAAPFTLSVDGFNRGGRIVRRVGSAAVGSIEGAQRVLIADEVEITPPVGTTLSVGDRVIAVQDFGALPTGMRVVLPGGVLQVVRADAGKPVVARVKSQSGLIEQGHRVLAISWQPAALVRAAATSEPLRASVVWVDGQSLLPTLQSYVLLDAGTTKGVKSGDEFALVRARGSVNTGVEERIAVVRIVRSDAAASTAIVVKQDKGEIGPGLSARLVARIP
ncbi:MAG TPA: LysM peptidoglycan-binding domain-containing protein [Gemmatimonas sp.]|nr:LysM peptidoglycan-binding domain-containing protein [Gemmatimonas sp.]